MHPCWEGSAVDAPPFEEVLIEVRYVRCVGKDGRTWHTATHGTAALVAAGIHVMHTGSML
jgi:hypothetical protein